MNRSDRHDRTPRILIELLDSVQNNEYIIHMTTVHMNGIHLNQLRLIEALDRNGSLGEAAEEIGLTQSAASHALARLRRGVQDQIFVRTLDGMRPTPYGARLAESVRQALQSIRAGLVQPTNFNPSTSLRTFNVIMSDVSQFLYLPKLVTQLSDEAPGISLHTHEIPIKTPHLVLESGDVDLAVGAFTKLIIGCRQRRLYRERYVCVARHDHPKFKQGMNVDAFCDVPHIIVDPRGHVHEHLDKWLTQQKVSRKGKLFVPYFLSLLPVFAESDLTVIMAERLAHAFAKMVPLKIMAPPVKLPAYNISLFWHERFDQDPANCWLRAQYMNLFREK